MKLQCQCSSLRCSSISKCSILCSFASYVVSHCMRNSPFSSRESKNLSSRPEYLHQLLHDHYWRLHSLTRVRGFILLLAMTLPCIYPPSCPLSQIDRPEHPIRVQVNFQIRLHCKRSSPRLKPQHSFRRRSITHRFPVSLCSIFSQYSWRTMLELDT